jgi:hypothetical protein
MFTFKSPSAEGEVEQFLIAKPLPFHLSLKNSRFSTKIFNPNPASDKHLGPKGIELKTSISEIKEPAVARTETSIRRNIQRTFLSRENCQIFLLVSKYPIGPERITVLIRIKTSTASEYIFLV